MNRIQHDVVSAARRWIGTPYRHQAAKRDAGTDCLGLIRGVWRDVIGAEPVVVPAYSMDWSEPQGEERLWAAARQHLVDVSAQRMDLAPGDVVLFRMRESSVAKHLGIIAECTQTPTFIHAYSRHGVIESPLSAPWRRRIVARFKYPLELI